MDLFKENKEFNKARRDANLEICEKLTKFCKDKNNKAIRFGQVLACLGITEEKFNEEPWITLAKIDEKLSKREE